MEAATLLLGRMLEADHDKRITPSEILQHPFIRDELENPSVRQLYIPTEDQEDERDIFNKPLTREEISAVLPEGFKVIKMLGSGRFGQVFNCRRVDTGKSVTIKLPYSHNKTQREIQLLETIAEQKADHKNIVTFIETLPTGRGEALVLEELSMNLASYIKQRSPLPMSDIRAVIQQTATALQTLESKGIIHTGVTMENIWLCHRSNEPIKIKLADFGAFIEQKRTIPGMTAQRVHYRAPEIILGLPFDEAIDVWSLGTMSVTLLTGCDLFPDRTEFETLTTIVKIFGQPPDYVLSEAINTHEYFNADGASWKIKTAQEFEESSQLPQNTIKTHETDAFDSLDEVIQSSVAHSYDSAELAACIDLVKAMLTLDGTQRITPAQILEHDFISMSREVEAPVSEEQVDAVQKPLKSPVFITVKPASPENTTAFVEDPPVSKSFTPVKGLKMSESTRSLTRLLAEAQRWRRRRRRCWRRRGGGSGGGGSGGSSGSGGSGAEAAVGGGAAAAAVWTMPSEPVLREKPKTIAQFLEQDKLQSGRMQSKMEARLDTEEKTKRYEPMT
ncbi:homeodomain-interacting protein kinase 1-like [Boleophthalmus pectinirostris]|uniref:homeodomain-interacting protein kinase 1-like n=1 Tax=Boleophthalmus pectinirostris TaxID=150288 RepID=UPI00242E61AF|nr:homeodomain-interacting protein kinase 1-like [Boleophthalmus pectinirostris]